MAMRLATVQPAVFERSDQPNMSKCLTGAASVNQPVALNRTSGMMLAVSYIAIKVLTMLRKIGRLFVIKTRFEAFLIVYALALGAVYVLGLLYLLVRGGAKALSFTSLRNSTLPPA